MHYHVTELSPQSSASIEITMSHHANRYATKCIYLHTLPLVRVWVSCIRFCCSHLKSHLLGHHRMLVLAKSVRARCDSQLTDAVTITWGVWWRGKQPVDNGTL